MTRDETYDFLEQLEDWVAAHPAGDPRHTAMRQARARAITTAQRIVLARILDNRDVVAILTNAPMALDLPEISDELAQWLTATEPLWRPGVRVPRTPSPPKRAVLYARRSEGEVEVESLEEQRRQCQAHADRRGYPVVCTLYELGPGWPVGAQLLHLRELVSAGAIDVVITTSPERLMPNRDFRESLIDSLRMAGVTVEVAMSSRVPSRV